MSRIIIAGVSGMLGYRLYNMAVESEHDVFGTIRRSKKNSLKEWFSDRHIYDEVDVFHMEKLLDIVDVLKPDVIINCIGAIKQIDWKKSEMIYLNSYFPHSFAEECMRRNIRVIHISSDCVFSGTRGCYSELDKPDPIDFYGLSKWMGEITDEPHLTVRTSFIGRELFSKYGLLEWFLSQEGIVEGYRNAYFSGMTAPELSKIILGLVDRDDITGLLHVHGEKISKLNLLKLMKKSFNKTNIEIVENNDYKIDRSLKSENDFDFNYTVQSMEDQLNLISVG